MRGKERVKNHWFRTMFSDKQTELSLVFVTQNLAFICIWEHDRNSLASIQYFLLTA